MGVDGVICGEKIGKSRNECGRSLALVVIFLD